MTGAEAVEAALVSERWASKAGVTIELVTTEAAARATISVLSQVWPEPDGDLPLTPALAWALAHSGNYLALARSEDGPVAAAVAFLGTDDEGLHLHSHMVGVLPTHQGANVGFALKQHQRAWALDRGLDRITWTFDPLVVRNAYFNVMKLGARLTKYYVDFYGELTDGINAGDESDRCLVTWDLTAARAVAAADGQVVPLSPTSLGAEWAKVLEPGADGRPQPTDPSGASRRLARVPLDAVAMRRVDSERARDWRHELRSVLVSAFADGLEVSGVSREGWYALGPTSRPR